MTEPEVAAEPEPEPEVEVAAPGPRTVGRLIADSLRAAGVRFAFTVPGESFLGLLDVLDDAGIRVVATRHEGGAAFMAEAYGQLTGRPAVCLGTRAVGAANLAIGIHTARQDSTPMFAIIGGLERAFGDWEAFQAADYAGTIGGLAKWAGVIREADDVGPIMTRAVHEALRGRPGPSFVEVTEDVLDEVAPPEVAIDTDRSPAPRPSDDEIRAVLHLLAGAERPVILAGAGVLRARTSSDLTKFAELLRVPVIASWRRGDVMSNDHRLYLGMAGMSSPSTVRERLEAADAMLVLGCRLGEPASFGYRVPRPGTRWIHVDLAPGGNGAVHDPELAVTSDARTFLRAANERLVSHGVLEASRVDARVERNEIDRAAFEAATIVDDVPWDGPGVHPGRIVTTLRTVLPDEAIITFDAGNFGGWAARGFRFRKPGTFLGPTSGAMGYGLPAAIAASLVHRDRAVVALVGDGGLAMTMAELETAVREKTRVVVLVFDNERYGTIRMWQERRGSGQGVATELGAIDFAAVARACGARGARVDRDADFEQALRQALAADRPTVIQLALDKRWVSVDAPPGA
jgi:acetolactate synthase-1/2/3 large subunit